MPRGIPKNKTKVLGDDLKEGVVPEVKIVDPKPGRCCGHPEVTHYGSEQRWCNTSGCVCQKWEA